MKYTVNSLNLLSSVTKSMWLDEMKQFALDTLLRFMLPAPSYENNFILFYFILYLSYSWLINEALNVYNSA